MKELLDFTDKLRQLSERVAKLKDSLTTEEATKTALIMPFFQSLGYDVFNPSEFTPEVTADVGIKKGERVDYAILKDGEPVILIECKPINAQLDKYAGQLIRYYVAKKSAKIGILTNGEIYKFYTDLEEKNIMDDTPFLEFSLLNIKKNQIPEIAKFQKSEFDLGAITSAASNLRDMELIRNELTKLFADPDDDFVRYIIKPFYTGLKTQSIIDHYRPLVQKTLPQYVNDLMADRLSTALHKADEETSKELSAVDINDNELKTKVVTTDFELDCHAVLRSILCETYDASRITWQDKESYFAILLDNKVTRWIGRVYSTQAINHIQLRGETSWIDFFEAVDLYKLKNRIVEACKQADPKTTKE